ncbi:TolC family outer membrane protein [Novilysobacter selenitireducens]|uniref:TolC family outer membrane protein n=1 Tax=Novilysobacter selenitireducens TaxID=2872639 RepID=A0ABS7T9L6_9GAMM|nr:TolC family outer membrane protein [Lysobacter selenitireducens]MBZ4040596.1 TolC family outer membrane protein [Lysobacter selenitireducens]
MLRRPVVLALAIALLPAAASAEDLLQTYELARQGDPQLSAAESNRLAIREGSVQARAAMLPQIGGSASLSRNRTDSDGIQAFGTTLVPDDGSNDSTTRQFGVRLDQMVFDLGNFTRLKSRNALSRSSDFQLESANDSLVTRTSAAYFTVLVALETLAAAEAAETALQKQFDFASKRLEVGLAPITDVHEARATYDSARANTILRRNEVEDAYQALAEITGQPVRDLQGLPEDFQPVLPASEGVDEWVQMAIDNNPALQAKAYQLQSAEADIQTARSGHWPTIYLGGNYGDTNTDGSTTDNIEDITRNFESNSQSRSIGVTLNVPIFSGGATQSGVRQAIALRDVTQDELVQQRRALERNTRNAYQALVAGISEIEARRLALFSARSALDASQVGLEVGTRTVLDVLTNQQNLFTAQQALAQARYNYLQNLLLLQQAAGTLDIEDVQAVNRLLTVDTEAQVQSDMVR